MAVRHGYGKIAGADALVFAYDTGDTRNSYRGEPTVNVFNSNGEGFDPLDLYTWATSGNTSTWSRDTTIERSPVGGIPLKETSSGTDSYSGTYGSGKWNLSSASIGQTWTVTVYAKATAGTNLQLWLFEADSNGAYGGITMQNFSATGNWQRLVVTRTLSDSDVASVQARVATSTNGGVVWWDGLQMEQNGHATPFTAGTRSDTQGLRDLTGSTSINLSNVSFDSNAQMAFDGSSDYISLPSTLTGSFNPNSFTVEAVVKYDSFGAINSSRPYVSNWNTWSPGSQKGFILRTFGESEYASFWWCDGVNYSSVTATTQMTTGQYYHITATYSPSVVVIYINGTLEGTSTALLSGIVFESTTRIGFGTINTGYFDGEIPVVKMYNRALPAAEVKNNYNNYKGRFNL